MLVRGEERRPATTEEIEAYSALRFINAYEDPGGDTMLRRYSHGGPSLQAKLFCAQAYLLKVLQEGVPENKKAPLQRLLGIIGAASQDAASVAKGLRRQVDTKTQLVVETRALTQQLSAMLGRVEGALKLRELEREGIAASAEWPHVRATAHSDAVETRGLLQQVMECRAAVAEFMEKHCPLGRNQKEVI